MENQKLKACLIGAGWIGLGAAADFLRRKPATHAEAIQMDPRFVLCGISDSDSQAAARVEKYASGVLFDANPSTLLAHCRPDVVIIASSPDSHCELIEAAVQAGVRGILVEKPISHNLEEAERVVQLCRAKGVILLVNHMRRMDPLLQEVRQNLSGDYVKDTSIGKVLSCTAYYDKGLFHCGTHIVDLMRYFLGDPEWVSGVENKSFSADHGDIAVDAILGFKGINAVLQVFNSPKYALTEFHLFGEKGRLTLRRSWGLEVEFTGVASSAEYSAYQELDYGSSRIFGEPRSWFAAGMNHLWDCLAGKANPLCSGEDALQTLRVLHAIESSVRQDGRRILV